MVANPVHLLGPLREAAQQTRAGQASEAYALFLFLRSKDFLAVGDSYAQPLAGPGFRPRAREHPPGRNRCSSPSGFPAAPPVSIADSIAAEGPAPGQRRPLVVSRPAFSKFESYQAALSSL